VKINPTARRIAEWSTVAILSLSFVASGIPKIAPGPGMVRRFEAWGYSSGFATGIGLLEALAGVLILVPKTRRLGAGLIAIDMVGAVYTHFRTGIGSPVIAFAYLVLAGIIVWTTGQGMSAGQDSTPDTKLA